MENPIKMDDLGVPLFSETPNHFLIISIYKLLHRLPFQGVAALLVQRVKCGVGFESQPCRGMAGSSMGTPWPDCKWMIVDDCKVLIKP